MIQPSSPPNADISLCSPPKELHKSLNFTRMEDGGHEENVKENMSLFKEYTPCLTMEFESEEAAYEFYNEYGRIAGFSIRRSYGTKSRKDNILISRKFVCSKEGEKEKDKRRLVVEQSRKETRTKCEASMYISLNRETSTWIVKKFEEKHNHPLHLTQCAHMMRSQRTLREAQAINVDIAADSGLSLKASHDLLSAQAGGREFLGFTREDQKNYLRARRQRSLEYGEAGALLGYFQKQASENPYFYYAVQLDVDEMIANIFWADHEMISDYRLFGDAISFDTTFRTNKEYRPFGLFTGFNHFRMTTVFGAALLYDETTESFEWLFNTFLHAMSGKKPVTIFTDQDAAMAKAISIVMPTVSHGLCTFHLNQNALKHLGHLFKGDSNFGKEFNTCIFGYEDEKELIEAWDILINKYNLHDNMWMKKTWEIREKWAHVYMKWSFTTGMRSTQLSESLNARLKKSLKSDLDIVQFFTQFDTIVIEKRYEEAKSIYNSREKLPRLKLKKCPMLIQVAQLYTPPLFDLFHDEVDTSLCCKVKQCHELDGKFDCVITLYGEDVEYVVRGNVELDEFDNNICLDVCCSCRKFENFGILCSHAIKGLDRMSVMEIPKCYVLGRWRLNAKDCKLEEKKVIVDDHDPKLAKAARFRILCLMMVKIATRASEHEETYQYVKENGEDMVAQVANMLLGVGGSIEVEAKEVKKIDPQFAQVKGLKKKDSIRKGGKRLKPWHEKSRKRKKVVAQSTRLTEDIEVPYVPHMVGHVDNLSSVRSCSQASYNPQTSEAMSFDPTSYSSVGADSFFLDDSLHQFLNYSKDSQQK